MSTGKFTPVPVYHPQDPTKMIWSGRGRKSKAYKELYPNNDHPRPATQEQPAASEGTEASK